MGNTTVNASAGTNRKVYAGNPWTTADTILLYFFPLFMGFLFYQKPPQSVFSYVFCFAALIIFFMKQSIEMDYFIWEQNKMIIKNHFAPWDHTVIDIASIRSFEIEKPGRLPLSLRINTDDNRSELYRAASLRNKHWRAFRDDMIALGIPVSVNAGIG